jgi:hypothetical protein
MAPDPRCKRGQRFEWRILLALISAALASGQKTPRAMAEWVTEHAQVLLAQLHPAKGRLPSATTLWRVLQKVDRAKMEQQVGDHNAALDQADTASGRLIACNAVPGKGHEICTTLHLLAGRDLRGTVTTMDALLTQRAIARQIPEQHGHYLMVVKPNQPELFRNLDDRELRPLRSRRNPG